MLRIPRIKAVSTYGDGATLDVPGSPRVILVPGHTPGNAALHVPSRDTLFVGDAIATLARYDRPHRSSHRAVHRRPRRGAGVTAPARGPGGGFVLPGHGQA